MNMQMNTQKMATQKQQKRRQKGGTVLGIVIGVLVGLGAALAVAVYVTKVPVPFMNKSASRGTGIEQDAAEAQKNKNWDPNAPLYGKNPAKPNPAASGAVGSVPDAATNTVAVAPKPGATASAAGKPAAKPASTDPLGDLAKAKTTATGSTAATADPFTYLVQAGAFRTPEDAEGQRAKLGMLGMDAKITEREQSGRTVYRVRVGPFNNKDDADKAKEKLDSGGFDTALVRVQR
jgi:cell division protein FtsN